MNKNLFTLFIFWYFLVPCKSSCSTQKVYDISQIKEIEKIIPAIVIGGGIAGMSAALSLIQEGVPCVVIAGPKPGGSLVQSQLVRNWPGKLGERGLKIVAEIWQHAYKMRIPIFEKEMVISVDFSIWPYRVVTRNFENGEEKKYLTLSCIIATGAEANRLDVPGESEESGYWGRGISICVWCDGPLYYGKKIIIIGGGRQSLFKADFMENIAREIVIVVRKDKFSVDDAEQISKLHEKKNIKILFNTEVKEFKGDGDFLTSVVMKNNKTDEQWEESVDGAFLAIGWKANTFAFQEKIDMNAQGAIILGQDQSTSVKGVFAAGEVCHLHYIQAIVGAGQGCVAALQAKDFLQEAGIFEQRLRSKLWWEMEIDVAQSPIQEIASQKEFKELIVESKKPVVVNFYSPWCSLCKNMLPILEECLDVFGDQINFFKININNSTIVCNQLIQLIHGNDLKSVPAILFIENGKEKGRFLGACSYDELVLKFRQYFGV